MMLNGHQTQELIQASFPVSQVVIEFLVVSPIFEAALSSGVLPGTTPALHGTAACPAAIASWAVMSQTSPLDYPSVA